MSGCHGQSGEASTQPGRALFAIFIVPIVAIGLTRHAVEQAQTPRLEQRIYAHLASWGVSLEGVARPISDEAIERHIEQLESPISEQRVQAARWLARRGVRSAGPRIAVAMTDAGTLRPCQLAKDLGELGDPRWLKLLTDAAADPSNADLQVCATIALGELGSRRAVETLKRQYRQGVAPVTAISALSEIGDPSTLAFLELVAQAPRNEGERLAAQRALRRVALMNRDDPVPALLELVRRDARAGAVNDWAIKQLVRLDDPRAPAALSETLIDAEGLSEPASATLAAALLAHGRVGREQLDGVVALADKNAALAARAALRLVRSEESTDSPSRQFASR